MPVFSTLIPETHNNASPGFVDILIRTQREELFTGLMQLRYPSNESLVFTFVDGTEQNLYRCHENTTELVPRLAWSQTLGHSEAAVGLLKLSLEATRFMRVAYEAPVVRTEQMKLNTQELLGHAGKWVLEPEPGIVHVRTGEVDRIYLFADRSNLILEELSFVDGKVQFSISDSSFGRTLPEAEHQVVRYISNREHAVWREYELRLAFNPLVRMLMKRFSELAGRGLTERLCGHLSAWAREGGWNITISSNGAVNRQYFDTLEAAVNAYTDILRCFQSEVMPAVGPRLVEIMFRETLMKLPPNFRDILSQYIYGQYGLGSAALIAQKGGT